jgi:hypothetical protein
MNEEKRSDQREIGLAVQSLRRTTAPRDLWERVEAQLRLPHVAPSPGVWRRPLRSPLLVAAATLAAIVMGTYVGLYRLYHAPSNWEVMSLAGVPTLHDGNLTSSGHLAVGQWLVTDSTSSAQLEIGRIGTAAVGPNSRVRMDSTRGLQHRLTLERGSLDAVITAPPRLFFVQTPSVLATDLGCAYTLRVDETGNTYIHVTAGWVELEHDGRVSLVPAGLVAEVEVGGGPGTPHPASLSNEARAALHRIDRGRGMMDDLRLVLDELQTSAPAITLRKERAITVWHLVQRVSGDMRTLAYEGLEALSPAPEGVVREGILALERPILERWRRDLNPLWSEESQPFFVRLARQFWDWTVR